LGSSGPPGAIRSCCAAAAEPALGTIRRSGASRRPTPNPPPSKPSPPRRRRHVTMSAAANSVRTASERRWAGCLVPFRQRWSPERRVSTTKGRSLVCKSSSAAARSGASVSVGRRSRRLATSRRRWIGLKRERATYGSSGNQRGPAPSRPRRSKGQYLDCLRFDAVLHTAGPGPPFGAECVARADCLRGGRLRSGRCMRRCGYQER
jgi:hypothetical protein